MREIVSLTALRGIAALWVCIFHQAQTPPVTTLEKLGHSGFLGVIIFFVLSGYILAYVYEDWFKHFDLSQYRRFLALRLARVYPLHVLTLLIVAGLIALHVMPLDANDSAYTFVLNVLLLQSWGFTNAISWNLASWSISTEAFCYLLFPFALFALNNTRWKLLTALSLIQIISHRTCGYDRDAKRTCQRSAAP